MEKTDIQILDAIDAGKYEGGPDGRMWTIDPVDGTKGFLRGDQYAICVSLIIDSEVKTRQYDKQRACLPGTRKKLLDDIEEWIHTSGAGPERILWLSGPAGTGKRV